MFNYLVVSRYTVTAQVATVRTHKRKRTGAPRNLAKSCSLRKTSAKYSANRMTQQRFCNRVEEVGGSKFYTKQFYKSCEKQELTFIVSLRWELTARIK
jgi:hypothetical protein